MKLIICSKGVRPVQEWIPYGDFETHWILGRDMVDRPGTVHQVVVDHKNPLAFKHQWAQDNLVRDGEQYLTMDDNVTGLTHLSPQWAEADREDRNRDIAVEEPMDIHTVLGIIKGRGAFIGVSCTDNPFYRKIAWSRKATVIGKFMLVTKDGLRWVPEDAPPFFCQSDKYRSLQVIQRYGRTAVYNWARAVFERSQPGGWGDQADIVGSRQRDRALMTDWFLDHFPDVCYEYKDKVRIR